MIDRIVRFWAWLKTPRGRLVLVGAGLLIILGYYSLGPRGFIRFLVLRGQALRLEQEIQDMRRKTDEYRRKAARTRSDPGQQETWVRRQLNYIKPNERVIKIVDPEKIPDSAQNPR